MTRYATQAPSVPAALSLARGLHARGYDQGGSREIGCPGRTGAHPLSNAM